MLNVFTCPNCRKRIETDQGEGQTIPCPYCEEAFTIRPSDAATRNSTREALIRLCIPLGYVLFVAVPLALTLWYFASRDGKRDPKDGAAEAPAAPVVKVEKKAAPPRPVRPPRQPKGGTPGDPGATDPDPDPPVRPDPVAPGGAELAIAPRPRELAEVFVAPEPHEVPWRPTLVESSSKWQKVGSVDVRIVGFAVTKAPVIDGKGLLTETAQPVLVVLMEVRLNATAKKRELLSWTYGQNHYAAIFLASGKELPFVHVPLGAKLNTGLPFTQPLPDDGTPVRDVLLFAVPPDESGELSLRLDAERCGEAGDIWFKIPAAALKK